MCRGTGLVWWWGLWCVPDTMQKYPVCDFLSPHINALSTLVLTEPIFISSGIQGGMHGAWGDDWHCIFKWILWWFNVISRTVSWEAPQLTWPAAWLHYDILGGQIWLKSREGWPLPEGLLVQSSSEKARPWTRAISDPLHTRLSSWPGQREML